MEGSPVAIPTNSTIPLTDVVRAGISSERIAMPVRGVVYVRLQHINAVPSLGDSGGYSFSRLQAIDSLLSRIARLQERTESDRKDITPTVAADPLAQQERLLDEASRRLVDDIESGLNRYGLAEGMILDMTA